MAPVKSVKPHQLLWLVLLLWLPALGQDWSEFERLRHEKKFQQAYKDAQAWPSGPDKDLAQIDCLLELERPDLAWGILTTLSPAEVPKHLRARFFLSRGRLQELQAQYTLASKDYSQSLRENPSSQTKARVFEQQAALALKLEDEKAIREAMQGFVDLPDQVDIALQAASNYAIADGRGSEALAILRLLQQQAANRGQDVRVAYYKLREVDALWKMGLPHRAYELALEIEKSPHLRLEASQHLECLVKLELMSTQMNQHHQEVAELLQARISEFSDPEKRARLLMRMGRDASTRALKEARDSAEPKLVILALLGSARVARQEGELEEAEAQLLEAASLAERNFDGYRGNGFLSGATMGEILKSQSKLAKQQGKPDKAAALLKQAIETEPGPYRARWRANAYHDLIELRLAASDYYGARSAFFAGLKEIEAAPQGQNKAFLTTYMINAFFATHRVWNLEQISLGMVGEFDPLGRLIMKELAQRPTELAWTLASYRDWVKEVRRRGDRPKLSEALAFQGQFLNSLGRYGEAESALLKAYEIATEENVTNVRQWSMMNLARSAYDQRELEKAATYIKKSIDILADKDISYSSYDIGLATLLAKLGRPEEALAIYDQFPQSGACLLSATDLASKMGDWELALTTSEKAIDFFQKRKRRELLFQAEIQKARALAHLGRTAESEALFQSLKEQAKFGQSLGTFQAWIEARKFLGKPHSDLDSLVTEAVGDMEQKLPRELVAPAASFDNSHFMTELHRMRGHDSQLDNLFQLNESELLTIQSRLRADQLFLYALPVGDRIVVVIVSVESMRLAEIQVDKIQRQRMITELVDNLARPKSSASAVANFTEKFSALLIPALQPELSKAKELEILAAGELRNLPFEVLVDETGKTLLEGFQVSYLDAVRPGLARPQPLTGTKLLLGGSKLPGAARELDRVGSILGEHARAQTLDELKEKSRNSSLIHVATHSEIQEDALGEGHFELGDQQVAFEDIYALGLPPGTLVVLSSCRSATGGQSRELVSLSSAFLFGGASTAIGSLWRVDDHSTETFFEYFYEELAQGTPPGGALRAAKIRLRKNPRTSHPYFWAPFVIYGRAE